MKRSYILFLAFLILISLMATSCAEKEKLDNNSDPDEYVGIYEWDQNAIHPLNSRNVKWSSEDGSIWFIVGERMDVDENSQGLYSEYFFGGIQTEDGLSEIRVHMDGRNNVISFADMEDADFDNYTLGTFDFTEESIVLTLDKSYDDFELMKGKYDTIIFYPEPLEK